MAPSVSEQQPRRPSPDCSYRTRAATGQRAIHTRWNTKASLSWRRSTAPRSSPIQGARSRRAAASLGRRLPRIMPTRTPQSLSRWRRSVLSRHNARVHIMDRRREAARSPCRSASADQARRFRSHARAGPQRRPPTTDHKRARHAVSRSGSALDRRGLLGRPSRRSSWSRLIAAYPSVWLQK
jgi:hypothetical protein